MCLAELILIRENAQSMIISISWKSVIQLCYATGTMLASNVHDVAQSSMAENDII